MRWRRRRFREGGGWSCLQKEPPPLLSSVVSCRLLLLLAVNHNHVFLVILQSILGMSKLVYLVATGLLETILPALLDKLDPQQVTVAVWDRERFKQEMQPHLQQTLGSLDASVARVFNQVLVVRDALRTVRGGEAVLCAEARSAIEAAEMLQLKLKKKGSELEATFELAKAFDTDGAFFKSIEGRYVLPVAERRWVPETPFAKSAPDAEPCSVGSTAVPNDTSEEQAWLRLRGLPWEASLQDVIDFLAPVFGAGLPTSKIHILQARQGRCSGEAYIEAPTEELRDRCIKDLHGNLIGRRWIEVFKSSSIEFEDAKQRCQQLAASEMSSGGILRLRGLPWGSTEYEVMRFFQDGGFAVEPSSIVVPPARGARCSGEAWVDLRSAARAEDARRTLHRQCIGTRYIEIFPSNHKEFYNAQKSAVAGAAPAAYPPTSSRLRSGRPSGRREGPYDDLAQSSGGSPSLEAADSYATRRMNGASAADVYHGVGGNDQRPATIVNLPETTRLSASPQQSFYFSSPPQPSNFGPPVTSTAATPSQSAAPRSRKFPNEAADQYPFTVLRLRGLPYGSNENHIVQFFLGFSMTTILPSTVPVDGRPSGEAYVEFVSPEEAMRAFQLQQGARIEHRYIELFPASKQEMEYAAAGLDPREIRLRLGYS
eukprot:Protomagalhaensia_sp_Gyna_25__5140@NODE_5_length_9194_cov_16_563845_g4_i0_p4_GENE_NODE_5_length_9194_cov_16_563845_g4_i0NODE_5_length_9194_cov_16_563845_g4_i0_p4_ORF_typecomplete_len655_score108_63RRM_1/PF00076_22/0_00066RRM_1/PF00076_22/0_00065RRM_1/PF00076_22/3_7e05RRM_5/PF13893_6/5_3e02RRM_5/PF13893_6/1_6RRM_5/PF13893_6/51HrpB1_HrpK/PF09613_10/0_13DUF3053/PF11254_8/0_25_NODE_5_length_9194_cov_16_563845_g4_i025394503